VKRRRLLYQIFPSYLIVTFLALLALTWFASRAVQRFFIGQIQHDLEARALLVRDQIGRQIPLDDSAALDALAKRLGHQTMTRITVVLSDGRVMGDTDEEPGRMEPHTGRGRPEIAAAFAGQTGQAIRHSSTLERTMLYVALPIRDDPALPPAGVVRLAIPLTAIHEAMHSVRLQIVLAATAAALLSAVASLLIARRLSRPLEDLRAGAEAFARGDFSHRLADTDITEFDSLAESMTRMAAELDERIRDITRQRNEQEAILRSMAEGVLAVDTACRVVSLNTSAARMLGVDAQQIRGRGIEESLRIPDVQRLLSGALAEGHLLEAQIVVRNGGDRYLQAHGAPVRDATGTMLGAVLVLNDITTLRRLERVRRDFVANVSHELKTPITSIKAAVETLQGGALNDAADAERFLGMIARRTDRLNAIIDDLLNLSRIEQLSEAQELTLALTDVAPILAAAVQVCEPKSHEKGSTIELDASENLRARVNPALIETAVVNLIDNAIKYSEGGSLIRVEASGENDEVVITVRDEGEGIEPRHLDRIFERFYRVDKARSSKLGGTGLGLAIVKHVAQVHGGRVTVESTPGLGSNFHIHLPLRTRIPNTALGS
jgi:two-component system, OmpR family, phosphate regulon sensor histidine kinase PhoR